MTSMSGRGLPAAWPPAECVALAADVAGYAFHQSSTPTHLEVPPLRSLRAAAGNSSSRDVAPVRSTSQVQLPGELWHCILFLVLLDGPRTPAPWRLAGVCKQWMYYHRLTFPLHSFAYQMQEQHRSPEWLKAGLKPTPSAQLMLAHSCVLPGEQLRKRLRKAAAQDPVPGAKRQSS